MFKIFRDMDPHITAGEISFFLMAAANKGLYMREIGDSLGLKVSTTSRYLKTLSITRGEDVTGLGLLRSRRGPENNRKVAILLTPKGRAVLQQMANCVGYKTTAQDDICPVQTLVYRVRPVAVRTRRHG